MLLKAACDAAYLQWSIKSLQDWDYFSYSVRAFFVLYFLLLVFIQYITRSIFPETHFTNIVISTDIAVIFFLLFFGSQTFEELKSDLIQISMKFMRMFVIVLIISSIITAIIFTVFSELSIRNLISANLPLVFLLLSFFLLIISIFRLLPFISSYFMLKIVKFCVIQSSKQSQISLDIFCVI